MSEQAGIWLRVSSKGQDEESQRPDVARWAESHGYDSAREYVIHGRSAFKGSRKFDEVWQRVLDDMRSGAISVLVVWKTDRMDRKLQTFKMLAEVVEAGGRVEFVTQPHLNDLTSMGGRIALKVQEEIAHAESKDKSDRILINHAAKRAAGSAIGRANWGYGIVRRDGVKVFAPTAEGRTYIPVVFQYVIDGKSLRWIAEYLLANTSRKWNELYLPRLIANPVYYGKRKNAGQLVTEPLVTYSTWQAANAAMRSRAKGGRRASVREKALLAPLCGNPECDATGPPDSPMYRVFVGPKSHRMAYYRCTGRGPQKRGCGNMVQTALADAWVTEAVLEDGYPNPARVFIAGDQRANKVGELRQAAMSAYLQGDRETFERLDAEASALEALPASPSRWEETYQCAVCGAVKDLVGCWAGGHAIVSRGEHFASLDADQRREELAQRWVVHATKDGVGIMPRAWV